MRRGEFGASLLLTAQFVIGSALIGQAGLGLLLATLFNNRKGCCARRSSPWPSPRGLSRKWWSLSPGSPFSTRNGTLNHILRDVRARRNRLAVRLSHVEHHLLQYVARNGLFDAAVLLGIRLDPAVVVGNRRRDRRERLAEVPRHFAAAVGTLHPHRHAADHACGHSTHLRPSC